MKPVLLGFLPLMLCLSFVSPSHAQESARDSKMPVVEKMTLHSATVPAANYKNSDDALPSEFHEICQILSENLNNGTLKKFIITDDLIDLDGNSTLERLIPTTHNADGGARGYDIVSQGQEGDISGFGLNDVLSILFLKIQGDTYLWAEALPDISSLLRFNAKIDNMWDVETICEFTREDKS